jgi:hypothetical protein
MCTLVAALVNRPIDSCVLGTTYNNVYTENSHAMEELLKTGNVLINHIRGIILSCVCKHDKKS